jgi:uncharacterized membrane protein
MSIARLLVMGALCGMRSLMPAALLSHRVQEQTDGEGNSCGLGTPAVTGVLTGLAALEVVGDKTPWIGPRIATVPLIGRASTGAWVGASLAEDADLCPITGAFLGAAAAVGAAYGMYHLRSRLDRELPVPDGVIGLTEDLVVLGAGSALATSSAVRR